MPVDIVVGGQAGDEGKGKITAYLARKDDCDYCVKVGGPNAGHTIFYRGKIFALKTIPSGFVNPRAKLVLGAGTYVLKDWFMREMEDTGTRSRIVMDPHAVIIEPRQTKRERENARMMKRIGSVGTGLGEAIKERIERRKIKFAKDDKFLSPFVEDVPELLNKELSRGKKVLLEGTQGMKLSLLHGEYPYVTSRDTTASAFLSEAGLGPKYVGDVYAVFKPYVTRTGPGPIKAEIKNHEKLGILHTRGREIGSVSGRLRRAGKFEFDTASRSVAINSATRLAITHLDVLDENFSATKPVDIKGNALKFLKKIERLTRVYPYPEIALISTGPELADTMDLRKRGFIFGEKRQSASACDRRVIKKRGYSPY